MGKIADAWVEIGAKTTGFANALGGLKSQLGGLLDSITGVSGSAELLTSLLASGFGKALLVVGGFAAAVGAAALALDAIYSRSDDQKFADSVAGLTGGFRGLAEEIKNTDKQIQDIMSRDATGGNGGWFSLSSWKALGERVIGIESMTSQIARNMANAVTASKLFADNMVRAAIAGREQAQAKGGAAMFAGLRLTAAQQEEQKRNAEAMKRVLDEQGGARVAEQVLERLRKNPAMVPAGVAPMAEAQRVAGALEQGDIEAIRNFGDLFDVAGQKAKIAVEEWMKAIPATNELAKLEEERRKKEEEFVKARISRQQRETEQAAKDMIKLEEQQVAMTERLAQFQADRTEQLNRSFQFSGLAEARDRLFMAAQDAKKDELTASKMQSEIDKVVKALDKLQLKWNMVS